MNKKYEIGKRGENYWFTRWLEYVSEWPACQMPSWMCDIIISECKEIGIDSPQHLIVKYPDAVRYAELLSETFGYTTHSVEGEICIAYKDGHKAFGSDDERHTLLHELAHWIVKDFDYETGGHTINFYSQLMRLVLKYEGTLENLWEESNAEAVCGGHNVWPGIQMFDTLYNKLGEEDE